MLTFITPHDTIENHEKFAAALSVIKVSMMLMIRGGTSKSFKEFQQQTFIEWREWFRMSNEGSNPETFAADIPLRKNTPQDSSIAENPTVLPGKKRCSDFQSQMFKHCNYKVFSNRGRNRV